MYILIGRTQDYAWSLTSAGHDVRDVFAEQLCETDASPPTRDSTHYVFNGQCTAMDTFNAGHLRRHPLIYHLTVHGPVFATATVGGQPYALSRRRSTFGRDALNLGALKDMTEGKASTALALLADGEQVRLHLQLGVRVATLDRVLHLRAPSRACARARSASADARHRRIRVARVPAAEQASARDSGPDGLLLNWNNRSAPGFMHGDDEPFGSVHRVEMFDRWPASVHITDNVGIMNRAATQDVRSPVWPVVSRVLAQGTAPDPRDQQVVDILDDWVVRDAPRLDADNDGNYDEAGPVIMDALWRPIANAVMSPVFGPLLGDLNTVRSLTVFRVSPTWTRTSARSSAIRW
jgi:hypothetical protein